MHVKVSFDADPPAFDMDSFSVSPLTCSNSDSNWSLSIPEILNNEAGEASVELVTSELTDYFILADATIMLDPEKFAYFTQNECKQTTRVEFELNLMSSLGDSSQKLSV